MNKIFFLSMIMGAISMFAQDRLYINNFDITAGESKTIEVLLDNQTEYCALQTDFVLPDGLTIDLDGDEYIIDPTNRCSNHAVSSNRLGNSAVRVFVSSQSSRLFTGTSGAILTIDLTASATFTNGEILVHNIVLVEADGTRHGFEDTTAGVNGGTLSLTGDVNGDGKVDVDDINILVNIMLGKTNAANYNGRTNVDGQGSVDVNDINVLLNIILGKLPQKNLSMRPKRTGLDRPKDASFNRIPITMKIIR